MSKNAAVVFVVVVVAVTSERKISDANFRSESTHIRRFWHAKSFWPQMSKHV